MVVRRVHGAQHARALWGPLTSATVMALGVWGVVALLADWSAPLRLVAGVLVGMVLYPAALRLLAPELPAAALSIIRRRRSAGAALETA